MKLEDQPEQYDLSADRCRRMEQEVKESLGWRSWKTIKANQKENTD